MSEDFRLPDGGRINRDRTIFFTFDGRTMRGHPGDTLASALLANGISTVARSFKYHRPRGIFSAGSEEPSAFVAVGSGGKAQPAVQATRIELYEGLEARSVNCWPSPDFDLGAGLGLVSRILPAGFYYKTFMWPPKLWRFYEWFIRRAAGIGRAPEGADSDAYDKMNLHCDVLIAGGGPAGLAAALAAGRAGARVVLADEQNEFGGRLLDERMTVDGRPADDWAKAALAELDAMPDATLLPRTTAFGRYDHNFFGLLERRTDHDPERLAGSRQRLWRVRAKQAVFATGAVERPIAFADNDRPGVMLAGAVRAYVNRYAVRPGSTVVVFGNNDDAYRTALDCADAGMAVAAVVDPRADPDGELPARVMAKGIPIMDGAAVVAAIGNKRVVGVRVAEIDRDGKPRNIKVIDCDLVAVSGGWNPVVHLHSHAGGKTRFDPGIHAFVPDKTLPGTRSAGAAAGEFSLNGCIGDGSEAGRAAALDAGFKKRGIHVVADATEPAETPMAAYWAPPPDAVPKGAKLFLDMADDVTVADVRLAAREGYVSVEHAKRYTTLGMGPDQGKTGNVGGIAVLADALGAEIPRVGTTTFRPPYTPVTFGAFAGRDIGDLADPIRRTPLHYWHEQAGAVFEDVGLWRRPRYFPKGAETMEQAVERECRAARTGVALLDASTLGKIEVHGPDALEFLERMYATDLATLAPRRCRYALMLGEDGMVMDDGIVTCLSPGRYFLNTTSSGAARVMQWLENWAQTEWPEMKVYLTSVTEQWANVNISGPKARALLAELAPGADLEFPPLSVREMTVAGIPARVFRVGFTGGPSYEINVPASAARALWSAASIGGARFGATPIGTEALHVLRAEVGFIAVGHETDGTTTPGDLGLDRLASRKKDFIGKRSLMRKDTARDGRKQLVGLLTHDRDLVPAEGAQIVSERKDAPPMAMIGHVTSAYRSPVLGRSIALALVANGRERRGETVFVSLGERMASAEITAPVFVDPKRLARDE